MRLKFKGISAPRASETSMRTMLAIFQIREGLLSVACGYLIIILAEDDVAAARAGRDDGKARGKNEKMVCLSLSMRQTPGNLLVRQARPRSKGKATPRRRGRNECTFAFCEREGHLLGQFQGKNIAVRRRGTKKTAEKSFFTSSAGSVLPRRSWRGNGHPFAVPSISSGIYSPHL